jgi:pyruvate dehydrogenase E2 component (dihydrolipoamide acetyltransferase)
MESGSISAWNLAAGDKFAPGDVFCSVETDKAVVDFEAQDEGVVAKLLVAAGAEVAVGSPVMIIVDDVSKVAAFADYVVAESAAAAVAAPPASSVPAESPVPLTSTAAPAVSAAAPPVASAKSGGKTFASPLARKLAKELGYDVASIHGTGPVGRVIAADVQAFQPSLVTAVTSPATIAVASPSDTPVAAPAAATPIAGQGYTDYPVSMSAAQVAARLVQSKRNVPHYYLTVDISADELLKLRRTVNASVNDATQQIGVYEFLIKAAAVSMKTVPAANAAWMESVVRMYDSVDINIVTGSGESLSTPVLRDCVGKGLRAISSALSKGINHESVDTGVGTMTMINVGMYGVKACAPIIREPQACAVAIGALQNRIVPSTKDGEIYQESVMFTVTASFDHRVVDGAVGAQWLAAFKTHVENPSTLLL